MTWVKGDTTLDGLAVAVKDYPERVFVGPRPPLLAEIDRRTAKNAPLCRQGYLPYGLCRQVDPWAQHLPILIVAAVDTHSRALVQPRCAGQVLRIGVQSNLVDSPRVELAKRVVQ